MTIYQLKITLKGVSNPAVWRSIEVPDNLNLHLLHGYIQKAMGWLSEHLYDFTVSGEHYGQGDAEDSEEISIKEAMPAVGAKITYDYDFGDGWRHSVELKKIIEADESLVYPRLTGGKGACPPEDCGGIWGYENFKEIMADKKHKDYKGMSEWYGDEDFDPNQFNLAAYQDGFHEEPIDFDFF